MLRLMYSETHGVADGLDQGTSRRSKLPDRNALAGTPSGAHFSDFCAVYQEYFARLKGHICKITRNAQDAEEIVQESFTRAFQHLDKFAGRSRLSTWIFSIATNTAFMRLRKQQRQKLVALAAELCQHPHRFEIRCPRLTPDRLLLKDERGRLLAKAMADLSPSLRAALVLHYWQEYSTRECAKILGISVCNAKTRIFRARLQLRKTLTKQYCRSHQTRNRVPSEQGSVFNRT